LFLASSFFKQLHQSHHDSVMIFPCFFPVHWKNPWVFSQVFSRFPRDVPWQNANRQTEALEMAALGCSQRNSSTRAFSAAELIWSNAGTWQGK
jgi:hypothetical protein